MGSEFISDGKKYISASRASKLSGYNSDYIGQLCRKGILDCRMVGRTWFVSETSVAEHEAAAGTATRGRIPIYQNQPDVKVSTTRSEPESAKEPTVTSGDTVQGGVSNPTFAYRSFHQDALNFLDRKESKRQNSLFVRKIGLGLVTVITAIIVVPFFVGSENAAEMHNPISYSADALSSLSEPMQQMMKEGMFSLRNGFLNLNDSAQKVSEEIRMTFFPQNSSEGKAQAGIAIFPASKNENVNDQIKQYVKNSFSDETEIIPDKSGSSGLVHPVFKNKNSQDYVYVIVPTK